MRTITILRATLAPAAALATFAFAPAASAANPACNTVPGGTAVYIAGSSAVKPVLKQISATLLAQAAPVRLIYQSVGSCQGLSDVLSAVGEKKTGSYWDATGTEASCDVDATNGQVPDIGVSDVYAGTCDGVTVTAGFQDFLGPVQVMTMIVPPSSKETAISAEAAYVIFGWGGSTNVIDPFNDKNNFFIRGGTSGTLRMIGKAIGLLPNQWKGIVPAAGGSGDVLAAVHNADTTAANSSIGILAADLADTNRGGNGAVKILAFQDKGKACGLYPDSSSVSFDKINVRNGSYPIWGPLHLVTKVNGNAPAAPAVASVINFFTRQNLAAADKKAMIDNEVAAHTVPQCAMQVKRDGEVPAASTAFTPDEPCGCYFEATATGKAPSSCASCTDNAGCSGSTPTCRYGFCEAK